MLEFICDTTIVDLEKRSPLNSNRTVMVFGLTWWTFHVYDKAVA